VGAKSIIVHHVICTNVAGAFTEKSGRVDSRVSGLEQFVHSSPPFNLISAAAAKGGAGLPGS
jgi:hypothetical protein